MDFKNVRQNTHIFILDKSERPSLQTGSVISVSQPMIKSQSNFNPTFHQFQPEYVVDIRVQVGEENHNFNQLPANLSIVDFSVNSGQKIVISADRDLIRAEVEAMMANSKAIIESVAKHENTIQECEKMVKNLNPSFEKEKQNDDTIKNLEEQIAGLKDQMQTLISALSKPNENNANPQKQQRS